MAIQRNYDIEESEAFAAEMAEAPVKIREDYAIYMSRQLVANPRQSTPRFRVHRFRRRDHANTYNIYSGLGYYITYEVDDEARKVLVLWPEFFNV